MNRRKFIAAASSGIATVTLAGCMENESPESSESTEVTGFSFTTIDGGSLSEPVVTESEDGSVTIQGTITVKDGCTTIAVGSDPEISEDNSNRIKTMIGTQPTDDADERMCTQALREIDYELQISYQGDVSQVQVAEAGENSQAVTLQI